MFQESIKWHFRINCHENNFYWFLQSKELTVSFTSLLQVFMFDFERIRVLDWLVWVVTVFLIRQMAIDGIQLRCLFGFVTKLTVLRWAIRVFTSRITAAIITFQLSIRSLSHFPQLSSFLPLRLLRSYHWINSCLLVLRPTIRLFKVELFIYQSVFDGLLRRIKLQFANEIELYSFVALLFIWIRQFERQQHALVENGLLEELVIKCIVLINFILWVHPIGNCALNVV